MKVSIIMGIYNCESTLQEALDSLYSQSYQDFEIILFDDGSTDGTRKIAEVNVASHPNVRLLVDTVNHGLSYALNQCLMVAKGEYIARMDGDDWSLPDRFEKEVTFLDSHPEYAFVSCPIIYYRNGKEYMRSITTKHEPSLTDFAVSSPFCHAPMMGRKSAFDIIGGYCEKWYCLQMEDYHLWMQFYQKNLKGYRLEEQLYVVRDEDASAGRRNFRRRVNESIVRWKICRNFKLPLIYYRYCFLPLILWALPRPIYRYLHKKRMSAH